MILDLRQLPTVQALLVRTIILGLTLWSILTSRWAPGLHGRELVVLIATVVAVAAWIAWTLIAIGSRYSRTLTPDVHVLAAVGGLLAFAAGGAGSVFAFAAMVSAGIRVASPRALTVTAIGIFAGAVGTILYAKTGLGLLAYSLGFVAVTLAANGRRLSLERTEQTELLLAQTQRSQEEQLRAARLAEQTRIARDIHDVLAHSLAGLTIQLEATAALIEQGADSASVLARVRRAHELARDGLRETRSAVGVLRGDASPARVRITSLVDGLRSDTGTAVTCVLDGDPDALGAPVGDTVVRVIQEALTNVRKHAPSADVAVRVVVDESGLVASVVNGAVESPGSLAATGGGYGLAGMRERAVAVGGVLDAGPEAGGGWRVVLRVPGAS